MENIFGIDIEEWIHPFGGARLTSAPSHRHLVNSVSTTRNPAATAFKRPPSHTKTGGNDPADIRATAER